MTDTPQPDSTRAEERRVEWPADAVAFGELAHQQLVAASESYGPMLHILAAGAAIETLMQERNVYRSALEVIGGWSYLHSPEVRYLCSDWCDEHPNCDDCNVRRVMELVDGALGGSDCTRLIAEDYIYLARNLVEKMREEHRHGDERFDPMCSICNDLEVFDAITKAHYPKEADDV